MPKGGPYFIYLFFFLRSEGGEASLMNDPKHVRHTFQILPLFTKMVDFVPLNASRA